MLHLEIIPEQKNCILKSWEEKKKGMAACCSYLVCDIKLRERERDNVAVFCLILNIKKKMIEREREGERECV